MPQCTVTQRHFNNAGTSTSRDDGTAEGTTGAPSVNLAIDEMEGDMVAPHVRSSYVTTFVSVKCSIGSA